LYLWWRKKTGNYCRGGSRTAPTHTNRIQIMRGKNQILNRHSVRLKEYDYSQAGAYFVTLCAQKRKPIFGNIIDGTMQMNGTGLIIAAAWRWVSEQYPYVKLDTWVVMPNHFHGIVSLLDDRRGGSRTAPTKKASPRSYCHGLTLQDCQPTLEERGGNFKEITACLGARRVRALNFFFI
jgi:REP element-mobilizing transposase RayT